MSDMDLAELLLEATEYPGWSSWCGDIIERLAAALAESEEQGVLYRANQPPCDGGCNVNDGPAEECSAHGRPVADVWEIVNRARYEVGEQAATIQAVRQWKIQWDLDPRQAMARWALEAILNA